MSEHLAGVIERVTFHNLDSGYAVLRVAARGQRGQVTVVGHLPAAVVGEYFEAEGEWEQNRDHGPQFRAASLKTTPPHTSEGIVRYLGSGLVKGIGPHFARKIVEVFGERTLAVIDENPGYLTEVKGIGAKRIHRIRQSWQEQKAVRSIMVFLQSYGVGTARAVRIYKTYGDDAIELVRSNPYRLATDIWGVGFKTADELAGRLGVARDSPLRAKAALRYVLQELNGKGHVGAPAELVLGQTAELTGIPDPIIEAAAEDLRQEGETVRDQPEGGEAPWLYLKSMFLAELGVARSVAALGRGDHPLPQLDADAAVQQAEQATGLELAPTQREAIVRATRNKMLVITGGPGVGKTTIVRGLLEVFSSRRQRCALCAPTGRAAKRLSESTGRDARTIHRLLEYDPSFGGFKRDHNNQLELDLLVVDEASMVDVVLMFQLLRAVPPWACVVLVGDVDQLPSVGPGSVLADLIASDVVPVVRLKEIFRQSGGSDIIRAAHAINAGEEPRSSAGATGDFYVIEADTPEAIHAKLLTLLRERIPARFGLDPARDVQVLAPMNKSSLGVTALNEVLQNALNPPAPGREEVKRFGWTFRVGDKVLQTQNDYQKEVFNGDIGRIASVDQINQELTVAFDERNVLYEFGELDELMPAYATSIHRSQGSEYPAVIVPLHMQHFVMLQRNLIYTAVTRGKRLVVILGQRGALRRAVTNVDQSQRFSLLQQRLRQQAAAV